MPLENALLTIQQSSNMHTAVQGPPFLERQFVSLLTVKLTMFLIRPVGYSRILIAV